MNVTDQRPERLELEHRPMHWIIGLGIVCAILAIALFKALLELSLGGVTISAVLLAALGWIWLTRIFLTVRLIADRGAGTLKISTTSLFGEQIAARALGDLTGAEVETRYGETSSVAEPGLVLKFGDERHRMKLFKPDPGDLLQAAESIKAWLARANTPQMKSGEERV